MPLQWALKDPGQGAFPWNLKPVEEQTPQIGEVNYPGEATPDQEFRDVTQIPFESTGQTLGYDWISGNPPLAPRTATGSFDFGPESGMLGGGGGGPGGKGGGGAPGGGPIGNLSLPGQHAGSSEFSMTPKERTQRDFMSQLMPLIANFLGMQAGGGAQPELQVPDFSAQGIQAAELARRRRGQALAEEAARTGSAGSRQLATGQGALDEALFNAIAEIVAGQAQRTFQSQLQARQLGAQERLAQMQHIFQVLQALGSFLR